jgi:hypothetical protein
MMKASASGHIREVCVVTDAVLSIVSSVVGGSLVLAGQFMAGRIEDRRAWLIRLHEAASDLATSYLQETAILNDRRRAGRDIAEVEATTYVVDRQKALGRFRTLPGSAQFETERLAMGQAIDGLWQAWTAPDDEFQRRYKQARAATASFTTAVAAFLDRYHARR